MRARSTPVRAGSTIPFIICYHRVVEDFNHSSRTAIPSMLISRAMLECQVDWLAKRFRIVTLDEIGVHLRTNTPFREPVAAITFDDGYADVYHNALPLLTRKGMPAAVFVVTDLVGTGRPQIFDRLYLLLRVLQQKGLPLAHTVGDAARSVDVSLDVNALKEAQNEPFTLMTLLLKALRRRDMEVVMTALEQSRAVDDALLQECAPLTWEMIDTMSRSGVTIGSHTKSHTLLTSESLETAKYELLESKRILESKLQVAISHFAYPDGRFNSRVVQAVHSAGYQFGYSICPWLDPNLPSLTISRKVLWERASVNVWGRFSSSIMGCHSRGVFDAVHGCGHDHSPTYSKETNGRIN
jgi:peptidoglycan/xylan/chitin deacetylase (PgdA/CDA1 family)